MSVIIDGSAGVTTNSGAVYNGIQSDTAKPATGTSVDFLDIPNWVKRITVMFNSVSTNGTSSPLLQLGSGSPSTSNYTAGISVDVNTATNVVAQSTSGYLLCTSSNSEGNAISGTVVCTLLNSNIWVASGNIVNASNVFSSVAGNNVLSGTLDRVRITTVNGTDTFDAGTINILYE